MVKGRGFLFAVTAAALITVAARAGDTLFEGYAKVMNGDVHVGYIIQRYEYLPKEKEFLSTYLLRTSELGGDIVESLKARAKEDFTPVSYQYTTMVGKKVKTIDGQFKTTAKGVSLVAKVNDGKDKSTVKWDLPKGAFLSTFLVYVILKSKSGLKPDTNYKYQAVAEEDAKVYDGVADVKGEEKIADRKLIRVNNKFKDSNFVSYINDKGETFQTDSPAQNISTKFVASKDEAVGKIAFPTTVVTALFGNVPDGKVNSLLTTPAKVATGQ